MRGVRVKMLKFTIPGKPIPKLRPRFTKKGVTYDSQKKEKLITKMVLLSQLRDAGFLRRLNGALTIDLRFYTPVPRSCSRRARNAKLGQPDLTRPDIDNFSKFYLDTMNQLVYEDDNQVYSMYCEKIYSDNPRVEITIKENGEAMINEHAVTIKENITVEELGYMIKKANRLGLLNRELIRVFMEEDNEGKHYYFECESPKQKELK